MSRALTADRDLNLPLLAQGAYYLATGIWSLVHYPSFEAITGPKVDTWLVRTVGVLVGVIGCVLIWTAARREERADTYALAYGSALGLTAIDAYFAGKGRISPVYLLDAIGEVGLVAAAVRAQRVR